MIDEYIPEPEREIDKPFMMSIEDVFSIKGRGTVVTGRIDRGTVKLNDPVEIVGLHEKSKPTVVTGDRDVPQAVGDGHGGRQCRVAAARHRPGRGGARHGAGEAEGSITPHRKFMSEVYVLREG